MRVRLLLVAILAFATAAGVIGLDWGLPYSWHPDEKVSTASAMVDRHSLDPDYFVNPSLHIYLVWALVRTAYAVHPGAIVPTGVGWGIRATWPDDPNRALIFLAYRLARLMSILFAALTVWLVWVRGRRAFDERAGLLAAASLALTMGLANLAHFATPETTLFFLVLLALGRFEALALRPSLANHALAGAAVGLACSTKYTVWLLGVPLVAAHVWGSRRLAGRGQAARLAVAAICAAGAFVLTTPYAVLSHRRFLEDLATNWVTGAPGGSLAGQHRTWGTYVLVLGNALGWPLFLAALFGTAYRLWHVREDDGPAQAAALVHGTWIASFWGFYGISPHHALRFIMPIVPSLLLIGAGGMTAALARAPRGAARRIAVASVALVLAYSVVYTAAGVHKFLQDPRYAAGNWLRLHVPRTTTLGFFTIDAYLPYFDRPAFEVRYFDVMLQSGIGGDPFRAQVEGILERGADIFVDANFFYERFSGSTGRYAGRAEMYRRLLAGTAPGGLRPVARFALRSPWWLDPRPELVAPEVVVFARSKTRWK